MTPDTDPHASSDAGPAPHSPAPRPPGFVQHRKAIIATFVSIIVVAGCIGIPQLVPTYGPASAVRAYMDAIHDGDVDTAFEYVLDRPMGEDARFLTSEAISNDWEVIELHKFETEASNFPDVEVRLKSQGTNVQAEFKTKQDVNGDWYIENPFVHVDFTKAPFDFAQVNGETGPSGSYPLFPGTYDFYDDNDVLRLQDPTRLIVPRLSDDITASTEVNFEWEPKEKAESKVQDAVNARIDSCADSIHPNTRNCPFGFEPRSSPSDYDGNAPYHVKNVTWSVDKYPKVKVSKRPGEELASQSQQTLAVDTADAGTIIAEGTEVKDGEDVPFRIECVIELSQMYAYVTKKHEAQLAGAPVWSNECDFSRKDG